MVWVEARLCNSLIVSHRSFKCGENNRQLSINRPECPKREEKMTAYDKEKIEFMAASRGFPVPSSPSAVGNVLEGIISRP